MHSDPRLLHLPEEVRRARAVSAKPGSPGRGHREGPVPAERRHDLLEGQVNYSCTGAGARGALVRYSAASRGDLILWRYRIEADYQEPHAGFAPVKITYQWEENGQPREDVHIARSPADAYAITCAQKPVLKSITLERAGR